MTKNDIKVLDKLKRERKDFADLSVEQLLLECIRSVGIAETMNVLAATNWSKWTKRSGYKGQSKKGYKSIGLIVENGKNLRDIRFDGEVFDFGEKCELVLRYL